MARLEFSGLDGLIEQMERTGRLHDQALVDAMLLAGAEAAKEVWKQVATEKGYIDSGEMINHIGYSKKPQRLDDAGFVSIYPQGTDSKTGVRNAEKAFRLHYGWSRKVGSNWVDEVSERMQAPCEAAMMGEYIKRTQQKGAK